MPPASRLRHRIGVAGALAASLVVPPRCGVCGQACAPDRALCRRCERALAARTPIAAPLPGVDAAWSAGAYRGVARDLVAGLKFGRRMALAGEAARLMAARVPPQLVVAPLVPVPPAPRRHRSRGFDSAERIAAALAGLVECELWPGLARTSSRRQVGRPRAQRLADPPAVRLASKPPPTATLVDDVATTGATLDACAAAMRAGGCDRVDAITFART